MFGLEKLKTLTDHEAQQLVRQHAGGDESHPQADVKLPGAFRLHPHEQTATQTQVLPLNDGRSALR